LALDGAVAVVLLVNNLASKRLWHFNQVRLLVQIATIFYEGAKLSAALALLKLNSIHRFDKINEIFVNNGKRD
jgi:hypothetical protein